MNNTCAITYDPRRLARNFATSGSYYDLAKLFLGNENEGHFYELADTANKIEQSMIKLSERKGGEIPPFSKGKFISAVKSLYKKSSKQSLSSDYLGRELNDIYENSNGALAYLENTLYQNLIKLSFINPDKRTVTIDNSALNSNIQDYKNELYSKITAFVKSKSPDFKIDTEDLYVNKRFNFNSGYKKIMDKFVDILKSMDYKPDMSYSDFEKRKMLDLFNAGIILSNFDKLVESKFKNIISVNSNAFGLLNNPINNFHYTIQFKGLSTNFWNKDSHESESADKHASNFVKVIAATIPLLDVNGKPRNDQFLGINGIYLLGVLIKNMNNAGKSIENFQVNPKQQLKVFLESLAGEKKLIYADKIKSLYNYLYHNRTGVVNLIKSKIAENPDIEPNIIDIEAIIAHQLNNVISPTYGMYSTIEDSNVKRVLNLVERDFLSDVVKNNIIDHILQNKNLYSNVTVDASGAVSYGDMSISGMVLNDISKTKIKDLTGINISNNFVTIFGKTQEFAKDKNTLGIAFAKLVAAGSAIIKATNESKGVNYEQLSKLLDTPEVIDILNSYIADLSPDANMTFKDSEGNNIPTVKQSNIAHEKRTVLDLAKKHFGATAGNMLFISHPDLYKGTETVLEIETESGKVAPVYLNPEENLFLSFVRNYLNPMMDLEEDTVKSGKFLSFQLVNYSDKSTILNELIDQNYTIDKRGSLKTMSLKDLKAMNVEYLQSFYGNLANKLFAHYSNLVVKTDKGFVKALPNLSSIKTTEGKINAINDFLSSLGANTKEQSKKLKEIIYNSWHYVQEQKKEGKISKDYNFEFTDEVAFSKYNDGLRFNRSISQYLLNTKNMPELANKMFVNKLVEIRPSISTNSLLGGSYSSKITRGNLINIFTTLGLLNEEDSKESKEQEVGRWAEIADTSVVKSVVLFKYKVNGVPFQVTNHNIKDIEISNDMTDVEVNPLLEKWLQTQNLVRYNSLALSTKHEYQHPHKSSITYSDNSEKSIIKEMTGRSISMTKRMVIHPATMEYYQQGLKYGVPPTIKLAVIDDLPCTSYNFTGDLKGHDAWDGSLMANPFLTHLLKKSFPAKGIVDVQKSIGTSAADTHSVFLKCALFGITNEMIRKSAGSAVDLDSIMKALNNIDIDPSIDLTKNSLNNNLIDFEQINPDGVFIKVGTEMLKLNELSRNEDGTYNILYTNVNTGESILDDNRPIKNLYDLWQVFGGAYSMSEVHGGYEYSDASIKAVGDLITIVGDGVLKDSMIGILAQKSSVKNGATNINDAGLLTTNNPSLMYSNFDTNFFGIQLDANHMSDDSVVNEVSQVISALAENQATPELFSELYDAIGTIIQSELEEYNKEFKNIDGTYNIEKISKEFVDVLKRDTKQIGNANEIIKLLETIAEKNLLTLPISNNNFYKGFVISVMSKMNSNFIKRKYPGLAAVLNPSYGMIQVYEDENGNTMFHDDLFDLAEEGDHVTDIKVPASLRNKLTVQNVINRLFPNKEIHPNEIKPLDNIVVRSKIVNGVDELFETNKELSTIGSKEEYSTYLSTIFPDSKVKDIVYHGTNADLSDGFSKEFSGSGSGSPIMRGDIYTTLQPETTLQYIKGVGTLENKTWTEQHFELKRLINENNRNKPIEEDIINKIITSGKWEGKTIEQLKQEYNFKGSNLQFVKTIYGIKEGESFNDYKKRKHQEFKNIWHNKKYNKAPYSLIVNIKNPLIHKTQDTDYTNFIKEAEKNSSDGLVMYDNNDAFRSDVIVAFDPDQIHILGSKQDIEGFKFFMNKTKGILTYNLKDINQYYQVKSELLNNPNLKIERIHNKPRDLKPVEISYKIKSEDSQKEEEINIFDNDPTRLLWAHQMYLKNGIVTDDIKIINNFASYIASKEGIQVTDEFIHKKLRQWSERSFALLAIKKNFKKVDVNTNFEEYFANDDFTSKLDLTNYSSNILEDISDYVHKDAEIIMPKRYRTEFSLGNNSLHKINSQGEAFFRNNLKGLIDPQKTNCDLFVSNSNGDKVYISVYSNDELKNLIDNGNLEKEPIFTRDVQKQGFKETWRVDTDGELMYKLPAGTRVYTDLEGNEVLVFNKGDKSIKNIESFLKSYKGQFIYPFANANPELKESLVKVAKKLNPLSFDKNIFDTDSFEQVSEYVLNNLSNNMFTSWQKSHDVVAARIPSQAMQSFMSMKTVGYNEDPGNNVYVSHWQIWLQGSDFDIDKAYIMMHGMKKGVYEGWSPFFKHDSYDNLKLSEQLPVPNKHTYGIDEEFGADLSGDILVYNTLDKNNLDLQFIINLLNKVKSFKAVKSNEDPAFKTLLGIINAHNTFEYSIDSLKNYVVRNIIETSRHPKNQISSYSPITFGKYEDVKKSRENNYTLSLMDGISMFQQQETNAVGKDVIGIAANGIKDYFALIEYFSKYYTGDINMKDKEYFERSFSLGTGELVKVNRIAGLNLERKAVDLLNEYSNGQLSNIINPNSDPSLVLSALLSAATDNAKELILKAINAGKEFAAMHLYLIILGFDEGKVAEFMTSPKILKIMENFKSNLFMNVPKKTSDKVVEKIDSDDPDLIEFKQIFSLSKELTFLAKILKINQGLSASSENLYLYFKNIENEFKNREKEFIAVNTGAVMATLGTKIENPFAVLDTFVAVDKPYLTDKVYINKTISDADSFGISNGGFNIEQYFSNDEYRLAAIEYYNLLKGTFNILDVVEKLGHFKGMVNATKNIENQLKILSRKYKFVDEVVKLLGLYSPNERQVNKIFDTFDDILIHKWFTEKVSKNELLTFNLKDVAALTNTTVKYYTKDGSLNELASDQDYQIDYGDDLNLFNFKLVIENNILPFLKISYPNNDFISGLILRKKDNRSWISTKVRMNKLNDPKSLDMLLSYQKGINSLKNQKISIGDANIRIDDLLYMYNVIVNKDKAGSDRITKLFNEYVKDPNSVARDFYEYQAKIDLDSSNNIDEVFPESDPISNYLEAIKFGTLSENGKLKEGFGSSETVTKQSNPNFVLVTSLSKESSYNEFRDLFKKLQKYIKNNNLLIELNCE